ncbi:DUF2631 domain-containing protein [Fodinicola acaciae]|uniref:DUF2631 domain-containing protein n=1 Tax=Fodinicola acaciae TaxID=2681555 RepID=UPI001FE33278|nr:DUF2631 domain-containing protein [Fodinicola acaciae]
MAEEEMVTSPDQHKPGPKKAARIGLLVVAVILLLMNFGNHRGHVEDLWLCGIAAGLIAILLVDWALRKNGLKRDS